MTVAVHIQAAALSIPDGYVDVPAHDVDHAEETIYTQDFEAYTDPDWTPAENVVAILSDADFHGGSYSLHVESSTSLSVVGIARIITGLTVGVAYTLTAWVHVLATCTPSIWCVGDGHQDGDPDNTGWQEITLHFTAGSTVRQLVFEFTFAGTAQGDVGNWDDITLVQDAYTEHVPDHVSYTKALDLLDGSVTLDDGWAPYGQSNLTIAMPDQDIIDSLDPRDDPRIVVTTAATHPHVPLLDSTRTFDLLIRSRVIDHVAATIAISLSTDEGLLQDYALVATEPDTSALQNQTSVRAIVGGVLDTAAAGAELEAGDTDSDFTTLTHVTNLLLNPSAEVDATNWSQGGGCTFARSTAQHYVGTACIAATATGTSGAMFAVNTADYPSASAGTKYAASAYVRSNTAGANATVTVRYLATGAAQLANYTSDPVTITTTEWTRVTVQAPEAPTGTVNIAVYVSFNGTASGRVIYMDAAMLVEGDGLATNGVDFVEYFDGATSDTSLYNYTWSDPTKPNASTSERTPVFERSPDVLTWQPGRTAWDFLSNILQTAGLRLFCDESRQWWLVGTNYTIDGTVTIAEKNNAYTASDSIDKTATADDGTPLWFDAVVVKYTWNDTNNQQQVRYDIAQATDTPTKVYLKEVNAPYPGPGAAKYWLFRANGAGRTLALTARLDYRVTPGMNVTVSLPDTDVQTGYVSSVQWSFGSDDMTVGTRALVDTPEFAWILLDEGESWLDSPTGASWIDETIEEDS